MRIGGRISLALFLSICVLGATAVRPSDNPVFDEALALLEQGDHRGAAERFEILVGESPHYLTGWNYLGYCRWRLGELDSAEGSLRRAVEIEPGSFEARYTLGRVLYDARRFEDSAREFRGALDAAAEPAQRDEVSRQLANGLFRAGEYDQARQFLEGRLRDHEAGSADLYLLGLTCQRLKDYSCALERLREARGVEPGRTGIDRTIAELSGYVVSRAPADEDSALQAIDEARRWVETEPGNPDATVHLVELLMRLERPGDALSAARSGFERHPEACLLSQHAARAALRLERFDTARELAERSVSCDPESATALNDMARAQLGAVRRVLAEGELPAKSAAVEERFTAANAALERSLQLDPDGEARALLADSSKLAQAYREQLKIDEDDRAADLVAQNRARCAELKVRLYRYRTAESTGETVERLDTEEREFLKATCGVELR